MEYTYINEDLPYKEKTCYASLGVWFYTTIKALKTLRKQVRIIHPNFGTLELLKVLTWPSESIWRTPHQCSLLSFLFLLCRYSFECVRIVYLTGDFCGIINKNTYFSSLWFCDITNSRNPTSNWFILKGLKSNSKLLIND